MGGRFRSGLARALELLSRWSVVLIAALWFAAAFATLIYEWGLNPLVFPAQDEAVVRLAARLISEHGHPFLTLPFPDPEDMAHPRQWLSQGTTALPIYAPVSLYGYGQLLRLGSVSLWLISVLPASAAAAFAAGVARLLPVARRWLALLAPLLGFVSFYWLMRPWMNLSMVLVCLCWAFFFWTLWIEKARTHWLAASLLAVGMAAAVRPDYAGFVLLCAVMLIVASRPASWKPVLLFASVAGVCAVVPNLILNKAETGHALRAVYQLALDRQYGDDPTHGLDNGLPGFAVLKVLFLPMGVPPWRVFQVEFKKYFVSMGPAPVLLLWQLALLPMLRQKTLISRLLLLATVLFSMFFVGTHLHNGLFGSGASIGMVHHSVPRYLAPVFLFGPLAPLLLIGRARSKWLFGLGSALALALAIDSGYELYVKQLSSFDFVHRWVRQKEASLDALSRAIPGNAIVYSVMDDKVLWSKWRVAFIADPQPTVSSMKRAVDAQLPVYVLEPSPGRKLRQLMALLKTENLKLTKLGHQPLYRLDRLPPAAAPAP